MRPNVREPIHPVETVRPVMPAPDWIAMTLNEFKRLVRSRLNVQKASVGYRISRLRKLIFCRHFNNALQLNHLQVTAETVYHSTPAERWAYFLQNADKLTPADVRRLFPDQEFSEAAGVLEMISKTPEQLMEYHARLKFQLDEIARAKAIDYAAEEARRIALEEGRQEGRITMLQELLGHRVWTAEEFAACDAAQLNTMADQLQQQLRARNS